MSIYGIGTDIAHIPRFVRLLSDHALRARLQRKMLHPLEIQQVSSIRASAAVNADVRVAEYVAGRWAVKEAVTKAFGARLLFPDIYLHSPNRTLNAAAVSTHTATAPALSAQVSVAAAATPAASSSHPQPARAASDPRPSLHFHGQCASLLAAAGVSAASSHVSLSHDGDYAIAFVTLVSESIPR